MLFDDLPIALVMEEILGWEKKPGQNDNDSSKNDGSSQNDAAAQK